MRLFLATIGALAVTLSSSAAHAGGVVIDYRQQAASAASRGVESVVLLSANATTSNPADAGNAAVTTQGSTNGTTGQQPTSGTTAPPSGNGKAPPGVPLPTPGNGTTMGDEVSTGTGTSSFGTTRFGPDDVSAPFDAAGCGGATTARGPMGLLPFGVAALALVLRRPR